MSEPRQLGRSIPSHVRFHSPTEQVLGERTQIEESTTLNSESPQHTRQIKELIRLGNVLRADLGLGEVLQQIAASISACTGFRVLVINLIEEGSNYVLPMAFAGISEDNARMLRESPLTLEQMQRLMYPEFRISQSYFIPHEHMDDFSDITWGGEKTEDTYEVGKWHPQDALLIPLYSPRRKKMLGLLSVDEPEDGKIPSLETIEVVELFANQAAIAIDNARLFQEREAEHHALEEAITLLREDLEQIQRGDLRVRVRFSHEKLRSIGDAINVMVEEMSGILGNVQMVTQAVDEHTRDVERSSSLLVRDASQQERQVQHILHVIEEISASMHQVAQRAEGLSRVAIDAMDVTMDGQSAVDRAVEGMGQVRDASMLSSRIMKQLGESGQEINETVSVLTDLTTRMHLLALNTAIEATRAGEHGQSFALIASEIRAVAISAAEAARKVATHIRTIQHETTAVSKSVEQTTQQVVMQTKLVTQTGVALDAINVVTEQMAGLVQGIYQTADSQAKGSEIVVGAVQQISQMTSEITLHIRQMQQSLTHLVQLTNSLRARMSIFRIVER